MEPGCLWRVWDALGNVGQLGFPKQDRVRTPERRGVATVSVKAVTVPAYLQPKFFGEQENQHSHGFIPLQSGAVVKMDLVLLFLMAEKRVTSLYRNLVLCYCSKGYHASSQWEVS